MEKKRKPILKVDATLKADKTRVDVLTIWQSDKFPNGGSVKLGEGLALVLANPGDYYINYWTNKEAAENAEAVVTAAREAFGF